MKNILGFSTRWFAALSWFENCLNIHSRSTLLSQLVMMLSLSPWVIITTIVESTLRWSGLRENSLIVSLNSYNIIKRIKTTTQVLVPKNYGLSLEMARASYKEIKNGRILLYKTQDKKQTLNKEWGQNFFTFNLKMQWI